MMIGTGIRTTRRRGLWWTNNNSPSSVSWPWLIVLCTCVSLLYTHRRNRAIFDHENASNNMNKMINNDLSAQSMALCAAAKKVRLACFVPTLFNSQNLVSLNAILQTWGKDCDTLRFITEPGGNSSFPPDLVLKSQSAQAQIVVLQNLKFNGHVKQCVSPEIPNPCKHLWEKTWKSWLWMREHAWDGEEADYFLKIDDDALPFLGNVRRYIAMKQWSPNEPHYFGHELFREANQSRSNYASGAMYGVSRAALEQMGNIFKDGMLPFSQELFHSQERNYTNIICYDRPGGPEDFLFARCARTINLVVEDTSDVLGRDSIILFPPGEAKRFAAKFWYRRGKPANRTYKGSFSPIPLALHSRPLKSPALRREIYSSIQRLLAALAKNDKVKIFNSKLYPRDFVEKVAQSLQMCG